MRAFVHVVICVSGKNENATSKATSKSQARKSAGVSGSSKTRSSTATQVDARSVRAMALAPVRRPGVHTTRTGVSTTERSQGIPSQPATRSSAVPSSPRAVSAAGTPVPGCFAADDDVGRAPCLPVSACFYFCRGFVGFSYLGTGNSVRPKILLVPVHDHKYSSLTPLNLKYVPVVLIIS
jgi:hypothetical protein